ncbi:metal dependent phosphohydrolase [Solidesulfovibrio carbinoliphilus subsp. oakridgensis]|uniref:Metal dependent phosphohydrolase n=1 Tax=Solidesulfovibrio carbinoliphilus subsp. oakridgensis TaxID=694327 RepID=G7Q4T6_9BACT|nr:HD domain-containing protein [Solidesulfovibrio carbinoliphilus]EHJ47546.1 metal dependent phosphohydrolase [Solidesulfovibrio carbinoliphilus subsp. oakridgensis]
MVSVRKSLLQLLFAGSFMKRWNDKHRSMDLVEIDKQAHKMMVAWMLYELNSRHLSEPDRLALGLEIVEGGLFEYLYRLVITDIKPPVFYQIKANPDHYGRLTAWVFDQLEPRVRDLGDDFGQRLREYLAVPEGTTPARRILDAAHLYASGWEYSLIKRDNPWDDELLEIESSFRDGLARFSDLAGVADLAAGLFEGKKTALGHFGRLLGQLRFQTRWSQTPRIPETSVLGHMFLVAAYAYFFSLAVDACPARRLNNFFAGLVHDMPELLTRDIISPVKQSVAELGGMIKEYENAEMTRRVFSVLTEGGYAGLSDRLAYFLGIEIGSEFYECIRDEEGRAVRITPEDLSERCNLDSFDPKDGQLLKVCDSLAAFIEAYTALRNGITSDQLQRAVWRLRTQYAAVVLFGRVHVGALLADFD